MSKSPTTNRFRIFLQLKAEEIGDSLTHIDWTLALVIAFPAILIGSICGSYSSILWICFVSNFILYFTFGLTMVLGAILVIVLVVSFLGSLFKWLRDNWKMAGEISERRKANQL